MEKLRITVFGGSSPRPGEPAYDEALRLGQLLGQAGCTLLTGGYIGTMEAVSCGAAAAGAPVIGVTCDEIERWRPVGPNAWVSEEMRFPSLRLRLFGLIENCDAAIALPGGAGTLAEISLMWVHMLTRAIPRRPLILLGRAWKSSFEAYFAALGEYIPEPDRQYLTFCDTVDEVMELLNDMKNLPGMQQ
jgi:uncharacterized protein (TIGR00725 family)